MNCRECKNGYVEVFKECGMAASMCCGGCTEREICFVCDGTTEIDPSILDYDTYRMYDLHKRLILHDRGHLQLIEYLAETVNEQALNTKLLEI